MKVNFVLVGKCRNVNPPGFHDLLGYDPHRIQASFANYQKAERLEAQRPHDEYPELPLTTEPATTFGQLGGVGQNSEDARQWRP